MVGPHKRWQAFKVIKLSAANNTSACTVLRAFCMPTSRMLAGCNRGQPGLANTHRTGGMCFLLVLVIHVVWDLELLQAVVTAHPRWVKCIPVFKQLLRDFYQHSIAVAEQDTHVTAWRQLMCYDGKVVLVQILSEMVVDLGSRTKTSLQSVAKSFFSPSSKGVPNLYATMHTRAGSPVPTL